MGHACLRLGFYACVNACCRAHFFYFFICLFLWFHICLDFHSEESDCAQHKKYMTPLLLTWLGLMQLHLDWKFIGLKGFLGT